MWLLGKVNCSIIKINNSLLMNNYPYLSITIQVPKAFGKFWCSTSLSLRLTKNPFHTSETRRLNPFHASGLFVYPQKASGNLWFSDISGVVERGQGMRCIK